MTFLHRRIFEPILQSPEALKTQAGRPLLVAATRPRRTPLVHETFGTCNEVAIPESRVLLFERRRSS
jgi:hypothetical protein